MRESVGKSEALYKRHPFTREEIAKADRELAEGKWITLDELKKEFLPTNAAH